MQRRRGEWRWRWCAWGACVLMGLVAEPLAALAGPADVAPEPAGYWTGEINGAVPATLSGGRVLHAPALAALVARQHAVVIDVSNAPRRPPELAPGAPWLPVPHRALPGALWLPGVGAGDISAGLEAFYRDRLLEATGGDRDRPVVVYCHERCWLSWNAAKRAISYGYRHVTWFPEGIEGWTATGHPTVAVQAREPAALPRLAVLDLELTGDLGGPDFTEQHEARLRVESERLRGDLQRTGDYQLVDLAPAQDAIARLRAQQAYLHDCNGCDLDVGRQLDADLTMVAWVDRVSNLILSLTYEIHDVKTGQITARKSFDFRGDNDSAWNHAIDYMVRDLHPAGH